MGEDVCVDSKVEVVVVKINLLRGGRRHGN